VDFYANNGTTNTLVGTATTGTAGNYSFNWTNVAVGSYSITAKATDNYGAVTNSAAVPVTTTQASSTTTVTATPNPATAGQTTTLTASVTGSNPSGSVTFKDGTTILGTGTLTAGSASLSYTFTIAGAHSITAEYAGDSNNAASTSVAAALTVNPAATSTSLTVTPNSTTVGNTIAVTVTVNVTGVNPTGMVSLMEGTTNLGAVPLPVGSSSLSATVSYTATTTGSHNITAVYAGDANNAASTSAAVTLTVNPATSTTTVTATPNPATAGQAATLTANVTGVNATGSVTFKDGTTILGTGTLTADSASLSYTFNTAGAHSITADYAGDSNNAVSISTPVNMVVMAVSTTTLTVTPNPAKPGEPLSLTATVTGFYPSGTVTFMDGAINIGTATLTADIATFNTGFMVDGPHSLTAVFGGDPINTGSTSTPVNLTINSGIAQAYYIHADHLDTPRQITDTAGNVVWDWQNTDPFGNNPPNENPSGQGTFTCNLRHPGQYFDIETGLFQNHFRDYNPAIGAYIESDLIGLAGGINTYAYVGGNPLSYVDPLGLYTEIIVWQPVTWTDSSFGHISSNVNGTNYSWGPKGWDTNSSASNYAENQTKFRSGVGTILKLTPDQEKKLIACYAKKRDDYDKFGNNCGNPHKDCLKEATGVSFSDSLFPVNIGNDSLNSTYYGGSKFYSGPSRGFGSDAPWAR
jgi:RHS repeat-associated protein